MEIEVEDDAIYFLAEKKTNMRKEKMLFKLFEMEDNVKVNHLMKKGFFIEAQQVASAAKFP